MITEDVKNTLRQYAASMQNKVSFVLQTGEHAKRPELLEFLSGIAEVSEKIDLQQRDVDVLRSPISFLLEVEGRDTGVRFSGIPSGHEFNSLILAMLQAAGTEIKLDKELRRIVEGIGELLHFEVFVSLSCHNCPDVVQALNQLALINPAIQSEMIDGGLYPELIKERDIQGVPVVYLNGEVFSSGKISVAEIIEKLIARNPASLAVQSNEQLAPLQDVVVIGGGPAGVSAAIYSARKGLKVTLIADRIGGQVKDTMDIENLISVSKTTGPKLTNALQNHLEDYEITVREHVKVTALSQDKIKTVALSTGETIYSKTLILATGAKWRELGVPGEKENIGNGVAYCPHCDGPFFKGKDVAVVGGGNSGIEAALDLSAIVKSVKVLEFLPELKADKVLVDMAEARPNIHIMKNVATHAVSAENGKVSSLEYLDRDTEQEHSLPVDGIFVQIGLVPNSHFVQDVVECTAHGEIQINEKGQTSAEGIYAAGDVTTVPYKQIVISIGEGAKASLSAFEYLLARGDELESHYAALKKEQVIGNDDSATASKAAVGQEDAA